MKKQFTFDLQRFAELSLTQADGYYQIDSKADLQTLADYVNDGGDTSGLKFKLTANISDVDFHIGTADNMFKGTFEGDGKKITVNYNSTTENCALFNYIDGATIKTLTVDGTINTSAKCAAGIAARANGDCYIQNCTSSVTINSTVSGDGTHGGFVAVNNSWILFENCIFNGKLLGKNTIKCGGFIGWNKDTANVNNTNFFAPTEITIGTEGSATISRGNALGNSGCCYTQTFGTVQGTQVYKLNAPLPEGVTTSDTRTSGGTTYLKTSGTLNYNGKAYNYSVTGDTTITLDSGKLFVNGEELKLPFLYTLETDSDGYYLIGTLEQLQGFATYANEQADKRDYLEGKKFKLTADITLPTVAEGSSNWTAINTFKGEFNGDGHKIANMTIHTTGGSQGGLFQTVSRYGKVHNLNLTDINISGNFGYCGGIAVKNNDTIENCKVTGSIQGVSWLGGIAANNNGTIRNCFADVQISDVSCAGAVVGGQYTDGKIYSTSYHSDRPVNGGGNNGAGSVENVTVNKLYLLNLPEGVTAAGNGVQEIFGKYYFSFADVTVTLSELVGDITTFTTVAEDMTIAPSIGLDGDGTAANPYKIGSADDLKTLAAYVNQGNNCAGKYFKLTDNINLSGVNFAGIGNTATAFSGTFDGDGKTVSNLTINQAGGYQLGLFGNVDGATIKKVKVTGANITASGNLGAVVGYAKNSTIEDCSATGTISGRTDVGYVGGLIGYVGNYNTITKCKADVQVSGSDAYALFGWIDPSFNTISGCYYHGVEHGDVTGITQIYKLTIPAGVTASGNLVEFGGNTYAAQGAEISLTVNSDNNFHKVTGISGATASGTNYTCTVGTSDLEFKLEGFPKIGNLAFDGTDTYSISDADGLRALANFVNAGNNCAGMKFKLTQDITLSGTWTPIGTSRNCAFSGTFDGGNCTISGLKITQGEYQGLFGALDDATVTRVKLADVDITAHNWAGAVAGYAGISTISNCTASGTIKAVNYDSVGQYHGGIVGVLSGGTVDTCTFSGTVDGTKADYTAADDQGGIVGVVQVGSGTVKNSNFIGGTVSGGANLGAVSGDGGTFTNNHFYGTFGEGVNLSGGTQIFKLTMPEGVTAQGDSITIGDTTYYSGAVTFAGVKTGYTIDSVTLTQDTDITATLDDKNHYVIADNTSTLATTDNTKDYPDLVQVYALTLPQGVTAAGEDIYLTEGGVTYIKAGGTVTLNAGAGKLIINGQTVTGGTYQLTMTDDDISIGFTEENFMANENPLTPQDAIQKFMASLVSHGYAGSTDSLGTAMLDSAIQAASRFGSIEAVINAMKEDQVAAEKEAVEEVLGSEYAGKTLAEIDSSILSAAASTYDTANTGNAYYNSSNDGRSTVENFIKERKALIFLEKYCGIQLNKKFWMTSEGGVTTWGVATDNVDTGAITGSDANITLKVGDTLNDTTLTADDLSALATAYGNDRATLDGETLTIGTGTEKTDRTVVPEIFINTYTATTSAAQNIITGSRNWVVQATADDDTITANGADSINAGAGNDLITVNGEGATVTAGEGADTVEISAQVKNVTLTDLSTDDQMTISGTFEVGAVKVEDMMLVITDKTGTRKIKLGDFENATDATVNVSGASQKIGDWLTASGIDLDNLESTTYAASVGIGSNLTLPDDSDDGGRIAIDPDYTPSPVEVETPAKKITPSRRGAPSANRNTAGNDSPVTVNLNDHTTLDDGASVTVDGQAVGTVSSTYPEATTFTRNGLTIHLLGKSSSTSGKPTDSSGNSLITPLTYEQLTDDQKTIIAGLFKWWGADCLTLNEDSYGTDAGFNATTAAVKDIGLYFFNGDDSCNTLATVWNWGTGSSSNDGAATQLMLNVNMKYYNNLAADDVDGTTSASGAGFLDRTLAHEFTHAIMAANVRYFGFLPKFIKEGIAELTHGIDDERGTTIFNIAANDDQLAGSIDLTNTGTGSQTAGDGYAGGYMFLRYFARQAALQTITAPALGDITATVNLAQFQIGDSLYSDDSGNVSTDNNGILLGQVATDEQGTNYYQVVDNGVKQTVTTSEDIPDVYGVTANVKVIGTDDYDGVEVVEGATEVNTGGGNDFVQVTGQYATINTGAGDDNVYILDGGHNTIDLGDGDNYLEIQGAPYQGNGYLYAYHYGNSITGGTGDDTLTNGATTIYINAQGYVVDEQTEGATDYSFYRFNYDYNVDLGDGNNQINLSYVIDSDIKTGAGTDIVIIDYAENVNIDTGANVDFVDISGTGNLIDTGADIDYVALKAENSTVKTGAGDDYVVFGTLNDSLFASGYTILNSNLIDLGDGIDQVDFAGSNNTIIGGADDDYIQQISGGDGGNAYHFSGEFGDDSIEGFMSNDTIHIAEGNTFEFENNVLTVKSGSVIKGTIEFVNSEFTIANVVADLAAETVPVPLETDEQGNYLINDAADLTALAEFVNGGNDCAGLTFKLTANIDISGVAVMNNFAGTIDGDRHLLINADQNIFGNGIVDNLYYHGTATIDGGAIKVYMLDLPQGVTASGAIEFDGINYYGGEVTLTIGTGAALGNVAGIDNVAAAPDGRVIFDIASDVEITAENIFYAVTVNGATISGNSITVGGTDYYRGPVTLTAKTGYTVNSTTATINEVTTISARLDTDNHYVLADNTTILATESNTSDYPDLVQVYELTLPTGVTASGDTVAKYNGKIYAVGSVTFAGVKTGYTINSPVTINRDTTVTATFDRANHYVIANTTTLATAANTKDYPDLVQVYRLILPTGVTAQGSIVTTDNGRTYAAGSVTFTGVKTGYTINSPVTINRDTTVTATFDTANHYVLADNTTILATESNTSDYPDLMQVYELTLPTGVTATGNTVVTDNGKTYAAGEVTFTVDESKFIKVNVKIGDETITGSYNVTDDTTVTVEGFPQISGLTFNTTGDYYEISSAQNLNTLASYVNGGHNCAGLTFKVTANISDWSGVNFTPIGDDFNRFAGTFDGNDKTISNLKINLPENDYVGLFGCVKGGTIQNLTLKNVDIKGNEDVGGIVGYSLIGTITNCTVTGKVSGLNSVGGIVGHMDRGTISGNNVDVNIECDPYEDEDGEVIPDCGGLVGFNSADDGTVSNNIFHSNKDAVGINSCPVENNSRVYELTLNGVEVSGGETVTFNGTTYYKGDNVTLTIGTGAALGNVAGIDNVAADSNGQVTLTLNSDTTITAENIFYAVTVNGATISGNSISVDETDYYRGAVTLTAKTGYTIESTTATIESYTTINATLDTANHYAFKSGNDYTLATESNTTDYPDLVQVYELTLPTGVTATGNTVVTDNGKTYAAGSVTLKAAAGYTFENVTVNGTPDEDGVFTISGDTTVTADVTVIVNEDNEFNAAGTTVIVNGTTGDFSDNSTLYSITATQPNSTLVANAKNNTIIISSGGENVLTGGLGNDTYNFSAGGGIVTDYGIGATKNGDGTTATANGTDIVKVDGKVTGIYFERDGNTKKFATFTATIVYDDNQIVVLKDIVKKPTKTGSSPIYQTNDVAAATLKIWDTSGSKQAVLSATKLKKLFHDDIDLSDDQQAKVATLSELVQPTTDVTATSNGLQSSNPFATQLTFSGNTSKN